MLRPVTDSPAPRVLSEALVAPAPEGGEPAAQGMPPGVPRLSSYEQREAEQSAKQFHLGNANTRRYALLQRFAHNLRESPQYQHLQTRPPLEARYEQLADQVRGLIKTSQSLHETADGFAQAEKDYSAAVRALRSEGGWWKRLVPEAMLGRQVASRAEDVRRLEQAVDTLARQLDQHSREVDKVLFAAESVRWLQRPVTPPPDLGFKHIPFF